MSDGAPSQEVDPIESFNSDLIPADTPATEEVKSEEPKAEEPSEQSPADPVETPKLKIKFNHEEREITLDEAKELAQKGMNYDKAIAKAQQDARDSYIEEQGWVDAEGKPVKTEAHYKKALAEQKMREQYKDLPQDVQDELIKSKQFREQYESEQQIKQTESAKQADQVSFLTWFKEQNGRDFDSVKDQIPVEVWQDNAKGVPLISAYSKHENASLRSRIKQLEQNVQTALKAPVGSVTTHGSQEIAEEDDFLKGFNSVK